MPVNTSNPIGAKARFVLRASEGMNELLSSVAPGGATGTIESTPGGTAFVPASSETNWSIVVPSVDPYVSGSFTVNWHGVLRADTAQTLLQCNGSHGWVFRSEPWASNALAFRIVTYWWGNALYSPVVSVTDNTLHSVSLVFDDSTSKVSFYLDGGLVSSEAWTKDPGAMGSGQKFSITGHPTLPHKCITVQAYEGALSSGEIATLAANPFEIFPAAPTELTASNPQQTNSLSDGFVSVDGVLFGLPLTQSNTVSTGAVTRDQTLTIPSITQQQSLSRGSIDPLGRLREILRPVPKGQWVKVNVNTFMGCTIPNDDDDPSHTENSHHAVANAWPSFAWDHDLGRILFWGGGHANYNGNEIYIWDGSTGNWELGSLPSFVDTADSSLIPGKDAPQSSHTYSNNIYLPNNKMFCTFGGASTPSGGATEEKVSSDPTVTRKVGPWVFDLALADPNKVGGATGSGWNTVDVAQGSNAWQHRTDMVDPVEGGAAYGPNSHLGGAAVVIDDNGVDVAYVTMDNSSGFPFWCEYRFGDIRAGGRDTFRRVTYTANTVLFESWGTWDSKRKMFYRGAVGDQAHPNPEQHPELAAVHMSTASWGTKDTPIRIVDELGNPWATRVTADGRTQTHGAAYSESDDQLYLWSGMEENPGTYYAIAIPEWTPETGWASTTWTAVKHVPTEPAPNGRFAVSINGRLRSAPGLDAVVAIDQPSPDGLKDATVWLIKTTEAVSDLTVSNPTQGNAVSAGSVAQVHVLTGAGSTQTNSASAGAITVGTSIDLAASSLTQANLSSTGAITQGIMLICPASVQDNIAAASAIVQAHILAASSVTQSNSASSGAIYSGDNVLSSVVERAATFRPIKSVDVRFN